MLRFWLAVRDLLYAPSHRLNRAYHGLCCIRLQRVIVYESTMRNWFPPPHPCYVTLKRYSNKFQHCFVTSQQRIWTELPQVGTKATPDTREGRKEMFNLMTHSTYFVYGYMASNIWLRTTDTKDGKKKERKKKQRERDWTLPDVMTLSCRRVEKSVVF